MIKKLTYLNSILFVLILIGILIFACRKKTTNQSSVQNKSIISGSFESKFLRYKKGQKHIGQSDTNYIVTTWSDTAWKNERLYKQLILWTTSEAKNITYEVSDLSSTSGNKILSSNIKLNFATYVIGDALALTCGDQGSSRQSVQLADALYPNATTTMNANDNIKVWITANIPSTTVADTYKGTITIKTNDTIQKTFNIQFLVVNHQLPDAQNFSFHLDLWQFPFQLISLIKDKTIQPFSEDYFTLTTPFYKMLADAGQSAITTYIKDGAFNFGETMVKWTKNTNNTWSFDYTYFDKYVEKMMSLGITKQINCISLLGWNPTSIGYFDQATQKSLKLTFASIQDAQFATIWNTFLTDFKTHLKTKGWFDKAVLFMDENIEEDMKIVMKIIKDNDPNWKIGLSGRNMPQDIEQQLYDYSTIIGNNRNNISNNVVATFYTSCSQTRPNNYVCSQNSPAEMTWMAWYAKAKGLNGFLRWAYDYWQKTDPLNAQDKTNTAGDFHMIYRSSNNASSCQPISSIRFELLKDGIQDFEKMNILSNAQINTALSKFQSMSSGSTDNVTQLVIDGQTLIKKIAATN